MRIQELEHRVGIERATIRFYEKEGLITPVRSENGYRDYSEEDARELRRIKLLRELGISLETIRGIQQGTEDLTQVMRRQCAVLQSRQQQMERARRVCERISTDGVTYGELDTLRYESLLEAPLLPSVPKQGGGEAVYSEHPAREAHPWRRLFARMLDYLMTYILVWFIVVVVLRWRPVSGLLTLAVSYAAWFLMIPIEAAFLHFFGATPGKWIMGIRVEAAEGGKLYWSNALSRAWKALHVGMGFDIPILNLYCMFKGYKTHTMHFDTEWDCDCESEVTFRKFSWINVVLAIAVVVLANVANYFIEEDAWMPRHRTSESTVAQFAENYNHFNRVIWDNELERMDEDGQLEDLNYSVSMSLPDYGELEYEPYTQFQYELDGEYLKSITVHNTFYEWYWLDGYVEPGEPIDRFGYWAPSYVQLAIIAACSCQDGIDHDSLNGLIAEMVDDFGRPCSDGYTASYGAITCTWDLDLERFMDYEEDDAATDVYKVTVDLKIEFG